MGDFGRSIQVTARTSTSCTVGALTGDLARSFADIKEHRRRPAGRLYTIGVRAGIIVGRHGRSGRRKSETHDRRMSGRSNLGSRPRTWRVIAITCDGAELARSEGPLVTADRPSGRTTGCVSGFSVAGPLLFSRSVGWDSADWLSRSPSLHGIIPYSEGVSSRSARSMRSCAILIFLHGGDVDLSIATVRPLSSLRGATALIT